jgi:omega-amidase
MAEVKSLLRVAACQMAVTDDIEANTDRICVGIADAAARGAEVVAFPECAVSGYPPLCHESRYDIRLDLLPEAHQRVRGAARDAGIWVLVGSVMEDGLALLNTALVIAPDGQIRGHYEKLHLIEGDERFFAAGSRLPVFDMDGVLFGVQICYDARFPEPFRLLKQAGARVIFNLSNACGGDTWKIPVLEGVYRARASENCLYLVAVNAAGPLQMAVSRIVDTDGLSLAAANQDAEEMIVADLDLSRVGPGHFGCRRTDLFELSSRMGDASWRDETSPRLTM